MWCLVCIRSYVLIRPVEQKFLDNSLVVMETIGVLACSHHSYVQWRLSKEILCIQISPKSDQQLYIFDLFLQDCKMKWRCLDFVLAIYTETMLFN